MLEIIHREGAVWLRDALDTSALQALDAVDTTAQRPGVRLVADDPLRQALAPVDDLIRGFDPAMFPARVVAFNKTPETNWALPWHQDRVIAVRDRHDTPGYGNWTQKPGSWHCEPPLPVLEAMLFVRVHLDDVTAETGAMEIALGSHAKGYIASDVAPTVANSYQSHICEAARGDVLILHMLTLHRSLPATRPAARRVFRVDYAASPLPAPLQWAI